jgi:carboxyl-terminal processing protease
MGKQRVLIALCLVLILSLTARADNPPSTTATPDAAPSATGPSVLNEVWEIVRDHFYDPTLRGRDWAAIGARYRSVAASVPESERSAVLNRMLAELAASHTSHYTAADPAYYQLLDIFSSALRRELRRRFADGQISYPGIGVFTRQIDGKLFVSGVLAGLPAARAGLLVGDELLSADGLPYQPIGSFATRVGQEVTLQIRRQAAGPMQELRVVPEQIKPDEAFLQAMQQSARLFDADGARIGYIHVWSYAGGQYQRLLERELSTGTLKDAEALVFDLRDGWGGAQAHYLDIFQPHSPTVTLTERNGEVSVSNVKWRKPVVMLVNGGTRSGKEILAYGFKKYGLGEVVGTRTAGAVLAGRAFLLSDGSLLFLAVADVLVDGQRLEGIGVTPTIEVPFPLEYAQGKDPQLERAVAILSRALRG